MLKLLIAIAAGLVFAAPVSRSLAEMRAGQPRARGRSQAIHREVQRQVAGIAPDVRELRQSLCEGVRCGAAEEGAAGRRQGEGQDAPDPAQRARGEHRFDLPARRPDAARISVRHRLRQSQRAERGRPPRGDLLRRVAAERRRRCIQHGAAHRTGRPMRLLAWSLRQPRPATPNDAQVPDGQCSRCAALPASDALLRSFPRHPSSSAVRRQFALRSTRHRDARGSVDRAQSTNLPFI